jgi:hypothetical protein
MSQPLKQQYSIAIAKKAAAGDAVALAQLGNSKAFSLGFASFLADLVAAGVATMHHIVSTEPEDDITELLRVLPSDHPLTGKIRDARKAVLASQPTEWTLHEAGSINVGKDPSKCAMVVANAVIDGKRTKQMKGMKFWQWIVSLTPADHAKLRNLLTLAETKGWK